MFTKDDTGKLLQIKILGFQDKYKAGQSTVNNLKHIRTRIIAYL